MRVVGGLLLVVLVTGCKAHHQPLPPRESKVKEVTLRYQSGLRVVFEQHPGSKRVAMALLVGAGSANDPDGREGLAHFVEHLAFRSRPAGRLPMWDELDFAGVASSGAPTADAMTTSAATVFSGITPADRIDSVFPLMASLVVQPLLGVDDASLEVERSVVRNEHLLRNAHGGGDVLAAVTRAVLGFNALGARPVSGSTNSVAAITRAELEQFVTMYYRPEDVTVVLVGDLEPTAIDALVRRAFPPAWLAAGPNGPREPTRLHDSEDLDPVFAPADLPLVEAMVKERRLLFSWVVPGTLRPAGAAMPLVAESMEDSLAEVGRTEGVRRVTAELVPGPATSLIIVTAYLAPEASLDRVRSAFHHVTDFGVVTWGEWRQFSLSRLYVQQNLLEHAQSRALTFFARGEGPRAVDADEVRTSLRRLQTHGLIWPRAREVLVVPLVKTNVALGAPPTELTQGPRRVVVDPAMVKSVALPPPLPEVRRFTLENGLQVVLSRRTPVPMVTVSLGLPAGARHAPPGVAEVLTALSVWPAEGPMRRVGRPRIHVEADSTVVSLNGAAWDLPVLLDVFGHNLPPGVSWGGLALLQSVIARVREQLASTTESLAHPSLMAEVMPKGSSTLPPSLELDHLSRADFTRFVELAFRPNGAALVIDGELDLVATEALVRELFSDWRVQKEPLPARRELGVKPPRQPEPRVIEAQDAVLTEVALACRLPAAMTNEQRGGLALLQQALVLSFEDDLRRARGLTYGVQTSTTAYRTEDNLLRLVVTLDPRGKQVALARFLQHLDELDGAVWDEQVVDLARWRVAKQFLGTTATSPSVSRLLAGNLAAGIPFDDAVAMPGRLASTPVKWVDEAWSSCTDSMALEIEGERSSIEAVLKQRARK